VDIELSLLSALLAPQYEMAFLCRSPHSLEPFLMAFLSKLKAVLFGRAEAGIASESLSSPLEKALGLYKFLQ